MEISNGFLHSQTTQTERDRITIKLDRDLPRRLEQYGSLLESIRDYTISAALELVYRADKAFQAIL